MFTPNQSDVRRFFCEVHALLQAQKPLDPMQKLAARWVMLHPEYHPDLEDLQSALQNQYDIDAGRENPFLHLSMHLSIEEQCAIDQPHGIQATMQEITHRLGDLHEAHHLAMESLGQMIWQSQRSGLPPDGQQYLEHLQMAASKD